MALTLKERMIINKWEKKEEKRREKERRDEKAEYRKSNLNKAASYGGFKFKGKVARPRFKF